MSLAFMGTAVSITPLPQAGLHGRRILVCLDRSTLSRVCVPYAVALAKTFGSAMTLVHVMEPPADHAWPQSHSALGWEISRQEAERYLERVEQEVAEALGRPVDIRLEQGCPAERIVDVAREIGADVTVLGSSGEGAAPAWNLGSTVQEVLLSANCSVFVAHATVREKPEVTLSRILVPLDGSTRSESVLPTAVRIATAHGAELILVHVVQERMPTAFLHTTEDMALVRKLASRLAAGAEKYLDQLKDQLNHERVSVESLVMRHANENQCLLEAAKRHNVDLVILSAHGSDCDSNQSYGSVTTYLLTHSTVPLLVLQDLPEHETERPRRSDSTPPPASLRASFAPETV